MPFGASDGPGRLPTWREMHAFATHAEAIGLDSLWACDHFLSGPAGRPAEAIHEAWTIVAALAASTSTIELGQPVMPPGKRSRLGTRAHPPVVRRGAHAAAGIGRDGHGRVSRALSCRYSPYRLAAWSRASISGGVRAR